MRCASPHALKQEVTDDTTNCSRAQVDGDQQTAEVCRDSVSNQLSEEEEAEETLCELLVAYS